MTDVHRAHPTIVSHRVVRTTRACAQGQCPKIVEQFPVALVEQFETAAVVLLRLRCVSRRAGTSIPLAPACVVLRTLGPAGY